MVDNDDNSKDPLQQLLADDARSIDRHRLANFLKEYIRFDRATQELHCLNGFEKIDSNDLKIAVVLLAAKARALIFDQVNDAMSPIEIIKLEIMPEGSVKSAVKRLFDSRKIKKSSDGKYFIPNYSVGNIIAEVSGEEGNHV